ncbi:hypothetical protein BX666DRAFT_151065 [Dichotomocladium elegans]|nr:hypothetical protein BX666DRAFT_151065 [Dichotomocladium elegans]
MTPAPTSLPPIKHLLNLSHPQPTRSQYHLPSPPPLQGMDPLRAHGDYHSSNAPWGRLPSPATPPFDNKEEKRVLTTSFGTTAGSRFPCPVKLDPLQPTFTGAGQQRRPPIIIASHNHSARRQQQYHYHLASIVHRQNPPPGIEHVTPQPTNPPFSSSGNPILKRRRGRPPAKILDGSCIVEGGWIFLSPTVLSVDHSAHVSPSSATSSQHPNGNATILGGRAMPIQRQHKKQLIDAVGVQTYLATDLNQMQIPVRKRGRKPKRILQGHSCFVWKDMPIIRSPQATAKARDTAAANRVGKKKHKRRQYQTLWVQSQHQKSSVPDEDMRSADNQLEVRAKG